MYSGFFFFSLLCNLGSDTCARLANFRFTDTSLDFSLFFCSVCSIIRRLNAHSNRRRSSLEFENKLIT